MRIAINGLGRIGRIVLKNLLKTNLNVVAVNVPNNVESIIHLLKYDSVFGRSSLNPKLEGKEIVLGSKRIKLVQEKEVEKLPWKELGIDLVVEASGEFVDRQSAEKHLKSGAKKVLITAPGKNSDVILLPGVNEKIYNAKKHNIISAASCTTNSLAPLCKVLHENFEIEKGLMTTIHSYTNDQRLLDGSHKDLRRARAAALSMIPTTTGAAKMIGEVIPELKGKIDGLAVRVPTPNVSLTDLTVKVAKDTSIKEVNESFKKASENELKGILFFSEEPLVSIDFVGAEYSSIVDGLSTNVVEKNLVKVLSWYDNEAGYAQRVVDLCELISLKGF